MGEIGRRAPRIGSVDGLTTGKRIQALRLDLGLSPSALAAMADMSSQAISKLESDGSNEPSYLNGLRIANALGISPWKLAGEPEPETRARYGNTASTLQAPVSEAESPDPDLVQISRDLATLTAEVKKQRAEMKMLRDLVEPSAAPVRKRAVG